MWAGYVTLAANLVEYEFESARRSAISRAYYGAFNSARRWLEANGISIPDHRSHQEVWRTFRLAERAANGTKEKWQTVGELGGQLRPLRNQADYVDAVPGLDESAARAVDAAERILSLLDELEIN
jgi:uncharacterized protein (UPF0332 family)